MNINEMSKDELREYAKPREIDMRKGLVKLREEVAALKPPVSDELVTVGELDVVEIVDGVVIEGSPDAVVESKAVKMLWNPKTGLVFESTPDLLKNPDLEPHN